MRKIPAYFPLLLLILVTSCASPKSVSVQYREPDYWPTSGWKHSTPEEQGMDSASLAEMLEDISANGTATFLILHGEQDTAVPPGAGTNPI